MSIINSISLKVKICGLAAGFALLLGITLGVVVNHLLTNYMESVAQDKQTESLAMFHSLFEQHGKDFYIEDGKMYLGNYRITGNHSIPDAIFKGMGSVATIFQGDVRVATSVIKDNGERAIGTALAKGPVHDSIYQDKKSYRGMSKILGEMYYGAYDPIFDKDGNVIGCIGVALKQSDFMMIVNEIRNTIIWVLIGASILISAIMALFVSNLLKPLNGIQGVFDKLAHRDVSVHIPYTDWNEEIGSMAKALEQFRESIIEADRAAEEFQNKQAEAEHKAKNEMASNFEEAVAKYLSAMEESSRNLEEASKQMKETASKADQKSSIVASATEETSSSVQVVSNLIQQFKETVSEIRTMVDKSTDVVNSAVNEAELTNKKMTTLSDAAIKIGDVVELIKDIAAQTNLLALNASIQAAQAGDAGKSFTVVANEVKLLAQQTTDATKVIADQISSVQKETQESTSAIASITEVIQQMNEISERIATAVEEQSATTQEIARCADEAAKGTNEVASSILDVSQGVKSTELEVERVYEASDSVKNDINGVQSAINSFLTEIRKV